MEISSINKQQPSNSLRLLTVIITVLYVIEYHYIYENFVAFYFGYADINYQTLKDGRYLPLILQASLPIVFFKGVRNFSSFFSFFIYVLVYIPFVDALYTCGLPDSISTPYGVLFFLCMSLFFITDDISIGRRFVVRNKRLIPFHVFELITVGILLICVISNIGNMTFVNFLTDASDLYEKRAEYTSSGLSRIIFYFVLWLAHFLLPFLSVVYITNKKYVKLSVVILASVLVYMINMQKATIIIPILIVLAYSFYRKFEKSLIKIIPSAFIVLLLTLSLFLYLKSDIPLLFGIAAIFIMRTQCIEGMEFDRYMHFFEVENNPVTNYSHIGIINSITNSYPYPESIGRMVAGDVGNANATFWLMDGVAAGGLVGVVVISFVFIIIKGFFNSIGKKYNYMIVIFSMLFVFSAAANVSLFTVLLSEGFIVAYLTYVFVKIPLPKS